jgi:hypothetical protein
MSRQKKISLILPVFLFVLSIGPRVAYPGSEAALQKILPDYASIRFSPEAVRIPAAENEMSRRYLRLCEKWIPIGMRSFKDWPVRPNCGHFFGGVYWYGLETAGPAAMMAIVSTSPEYDEAATGYSRKQLREAAIKGLRYLCYTHDTGPADCLRPKESLGRPEPANTKWGERGKGFFPESQCSGTIHNLNLIAAFLPDMVDAETGQMLANINLDYMERFGAMPPASGVYHNTQMEENGWTASGLAAAYLLLPRHPQAEAWAKHAARWMFSTVTMPQDSFNQAPFADGQIVAELCNRVYTALPDGMAENHGIVHPSYLASGVSYMGVIALQYAVFGQTPPPHLFWNRRHIYDRLKETSDALGFAHRVQGMDWPYFNVGNATLHAIASLFLRDREAAYLERVGLDWVEKVQTINRGRIQDPEVAEICQTQQDPVAVTEYGGSGFAFPYLLHRVFGPGETPCSREEFLAATKGVRYYPHAGVLFHKHDRGQVSLSWRNQTMVMPLTNDGLELIGSARGSMLASIVVRDRPASEETVGLRVNNGRDRASAVVNQHLAQGSVARRVFFASLPDGRTLLIERLFAREEITVESLRQGYLHIVNEKFACAGDDGRARRTLYYPGGEKTFFGFPSRNPGDDITLPLDHPAWVNIDDRMSVFFQGSGATRYTNRHFFKVWHAVADDLELSVQETPRSFAKDALIGELTSLIVPGQKHGEIGGNPLVLAKTGEGFGAALVGDFLVWVNFGEQPCRHDAVFSAKAGDEMPVFPGVSALSGEGWTYEVAGDGLEGAILEARGVLKLADSRPGLRLRVEAVPGGAVYVTNPGRIRADVEWRTGQVRRAFALKPGATRILTGGSGEKAVSGP